MINNEVKITYSVNFFFESLFEHLIGFIQDDSLQFRKIDISALNMVEYTTTCADKEIDSSFQSPGLVIKIDSAIHSQRIKFIIMVL